MSKTTVCQQGILQQLLENMVYTSPTTLVLSLHTASPTEAGSVANELSAAAANGYIRRPVTFSVDTGSIWDNDADITFTITSWNASTTISHWGLHDDTTAGNMYYYGAFDGGGKSFSGSDNPVIEAGGLNIEED